MDFPTTGLQLDYFSPHPLNSVFDNASVFCFFFCLRGYIDETQRSRFSLMMVLFSSHMS